MRDIARRLDTAIERAQRQTDHRTLRILLSIRDGSVYGSKYLPEQILREYYLTRKR